MRSVKFIFFLIYFGLPLCIYGQLNNIVPNPSFENFKNRPLGWYYKGDHFTHAVKYWFSPATTSPDAYGPKVRIPKFWQSQGFGSVDAILGDSYVGLTVYGCNEGKSHCREFVSVELKEPLIVGQMYSFSFYIQGKSEGVLIDELGFLFSIGKPIIKDTEGVLMKMIKNNSESWEKVNLEFIAKDASTFLTIGNFLKDDKTKVVFNSGVHGYGYYYIDNISLVKVIPFLPIPYADNDLRLEKLEKGKEIILKNVHFDTAKSVLRPQSEVELNHLIDILEDNPRMKIEILGYTDNQGEIDYNQKLSESRTNEVGRFLLYKGGISIERFTTIGKGELNPIYENVTAEGRQSNRRVSFKIISL